MERVEAVLGNVGGVGSSELASLVSALIEKHGGVQGIVAHLQQRGLRATTKSWVGSGPNIPISAAQVQQVFGWDMLQDLAIESGMSLPEVAHKLAALLPQAIDRLTPGGVMPKA